MKKYFSKSVPISFYITWRCPPRLPASLRDSCEPSRVRGTSSPPQLLRSAVPASPYSTPPALPASSERYFPFKAKEGKIMEKTKKSKISNPFLFLSRSLGDVPRAFPRPCATPCEPSRVHGTSSLASAAPQPLPASGRSRCEISRNMKKIQKSQNFDFCNVTSFPS